MAHSSRTSDQHRAPATYDHATCCDHAAGLRYVLVAAGGAETGCDHAAGLRYFRGAARGAEVASADSADGGAAVASADVGATVTTVGARSSRFRGTTTPDSSDGSSLASAGKAMSGVAGATAGAGSSGTAAGIGVSGGIKESIAVSVTGSLTSSDGVVDAGFTVPRRPSAAPPARRTVCGSTATMFARCAVVTRGRTVDDHACGGVTVNPKIANM